MGEPIDRSKRRSGLARLAGLSIPALTFGTLGALMLLAAGFWTFNSARFLAGSVRVPGTVVRNVIEKPATSDLSRRNQRSTGPMYAPVVRFRTPDGQERELTGLGAGEAEYQEGQPVTVLVPTGHPERARIDSHQELWLGPIVVGIWGALFAGIGLLMTRLRF